MTVPKLRFKGFDKGWEKTTIQSLVDKNILDKPMDGNHGEIHPTAKDYVENGIPFVMASDIFDGQVALERSKKIKKQQADSLRKGFALEDDVLLTHKATIGQVAIVPKLDTPYVMLTPQVTYYRILDKDKLQKKFLKSSFEAPYFQEQLKALCTGATRQYIGISEQRKLPFSYCDSKEQTKIASFLSAVDDKITQLTQEQELLSEYKKGMMQQLFSQNLRFKADDGNEYEGWTLTTLDKYIHESGLKSVTENEYEVFTSSRKGLIPQNEYFENSRLTSRENIGFNIIQSDAITYRSRSDDGLFFFNQNTLGRTGIVSTYYPVFNMIAGNNKFLCEYLNFHKYEYVKYAVGTSQLVLSFSALKNIVFQMPVVAEQTKIANFLSAIDQKIDNVAAQIDQAKVWKKGLLQQMFV